MEFMEKLGYEFWMEESFEGEKKWWCSLLWKINAPLKNKITLSLALNN